MSNRTSLPGSSDTKSCWRKIGKHGGALLLCTFLLSGCGRLAAVLGYADSNTSSQTSVAGSGTAAPPNTTATAAGANTLASNSNPSGSGTAPNNVGSNNASGATNPGPVTIAPLNGPSGGPSGLDTAPPDANARPLLPGQSGEQLTPNGLPALQPHGVDLKNLFSEDIKDPVERIKRVENAVVEMRRDFDAVLPSIVRLVAVEQDMQDLTRQLGVLLQNEPQAIAAAAPGGAGGAAMPLSPLGVSNSVPPSSTGSGPGIVTNTTTPPVSQNALAPLNPNGAATPVNSSGALAPLAPLDGASPVNNVPAATMPVAPPAAPVAAVQNSSSVPVSLSPPASATGAGLQGQPFTPNGSALPAIAPLNSPAATVAGGSVSGAVASPQTQPGATVPAIAPAPVPASAGSETIGKNGIGASAGTVRDLRIGEHPGSTRLVIDSSAAITYKADLDNQEHLLVIDLPGAGWSSKTAEKLSTSPLITSWSVTANATGSHLILQLKGPAKILKQSTLPAAGTEPFKIVIDLAKS